MSAKGHGRKRGGAHEEEHENHERWLVSYADMMTLLMVLFIVMFAISQVDQKKFAALKDGLSTGFGATSSAPIGGGAQILDGGGAAPEQIVVNAGSGAAPVSSSSSSSASSSQLTAFRQSKARDEAEARAEIKRLASVEAQIRAALKAKGLLGAVRFKVTERGLVVALISDDVFFESASATLRPRGVEVLRAVQPTIQRVPNDVAIEGHANHLKVSTPVYPSNWELSAARAAGVARWFVDTGHVRDTRLSPTGYGSARPLYPVADPRGIRFNRRVDLVLVSDEPAAVRALLPKLAPELSDF